MFGERDSEWTDLWFVGRRIKSLGPRLIRDPLVRMTVKAQIRADDEERENAEPLVLRLLNKIGGADLKNA
jgi:hypothetical protein